MNCKSPDIAIIVPLLNESAELPELFATLAGQIGITFELILCDGGSSDDTLERSSTLAADCSFPVKIIQTEPGRGRQMNAGAAASTADLLLFLHADSRFEKSDALLKALNYRLAATKSGPDHFAARFGLRFRRNQPAPSLAYFFYEAKANLPRRDCIRGDQGFLLDRKTFGQINGFDESLPFLEDLRLVAATPSQIKWQLLPATVSTSARRFETEGLQERQTLNAIIVNNFLVGWDVFFESLPGLYRNHKPNLCGKLALFPILEGIQKLLQQSSAEWRKFFWRSTGVHVAANTWQLFFWLDARRAFLSGKSPEEIRPQWLDFFQQRLERFFVSQPAAWLAQALVRLWLSWMLFRGTRRTG